MGENRARNKRLDKRNQIGYYCSMKQLILALALVSLQAQALTMHILKPLAGKHYNERNHPDGLTWNENYLDSIGFGIEIDKIGLNYTYFHRNSLRHPSTYVHLTYQFYSKGILELDVMAGVRNGYPKKAKNRSKTDFIPSAGMGINLCGSKLCGGMVVTPILVVFGLKYKI